MKAESSENEANKNAEERTLETKTKSAMQYVNPKQYERILVRRAARKKLKAIMEQYKQFQHKFNRELNNKSYLHESRHNHAMKRARGPGGRFLTAQEISRLQEAKDNKESS